MRFLRENLPLKVASLILAMGVWFYVRGEDKPVQILSAPLELQNLPENLAIAGEVMDAVSVRVRAPDVVLRGLEAQPPLARADLSGLGPGEQFVRIPASTVSVPPEAEVLRISPEYVPIRLEKKVTKNLPVNARIAGEPAAGFVLGGASVQPSQVTAEGPESAIDDATEVETSLVRIDGRAQPFDVVADLFPDRRGVKVVNARSAVISIDIHERYATRVFQDVLVQPVGVTTGIIIEPARIDVTLEGPPAILGALEPVAVRVVVDLPEPPPADRRRLLVQPRVVLRVEETDNRISVKSIEPSNVSVRLGPGRSG